MPNTSSPSVRVYPDDRATARGRLGALLVTALTAALAAATLLATVLLGPASGAGAATGCRLQASAYGSSITLGSVVRSGRTAKVGVCANRGGIRRHNRTAEVHLPKVAHVYAVTSRVRTRHTAAHMPWRVTAQTHVARVVLLGQIHARAIVARATATSRRKHKLVGRTTILGLSLQGRNVPSPTKPNQRYSLPGLGTLVLNAQHRVRHGNRLTISVTALKLVLAKGNPLKQKGAIVIGHSVASVVLPTAS